MSASQVIIVRVYVTEADKLINAIMDFLHNEIKVQGVTIFKAVSGFGKSGALHSSELLSMSENLPLVVEFFDTSDKVEQAIKHLKTLVGPGHVVSWQATVNNE